MVVSQILATASTLNVQSVVVFFVVLLLTINWIRRPKNLPPGPRPWPILGNARGMKKGMLHLALEDWAKQYGSVMSVWMGSMLVVVLNDMEAVKEALIKQADCFSDRTQSTLAPQPLIGSFIFANGEVWKERRRFGLTAMRNLGMGKRSVENKINEEARYLIESFEGEGEKPFDPGHYILNAVSNIICTISFGYRFEYSDPKFAALISSSKENVSTVSFSDDSVVSRLLHRTAVKKRHERIHDISRFIQRIIDEHYESFDQNDIRDVIDMFILEIKQQEKQGKSGGEEATFDKSTIWRGIMDLFVAGTDTTTNTLTWLVLYMAVYPDVQKKVHQEIDDVIGRDRQPTIEDRNNMPYTHAVLMEMQRQRPVLPASVPHQTNYETDLFGYTIPANTSRRICLGETLAKMEMFIFFVNLLQRFTFSLPIGKPRPPLDGVAGITLSPHPYEIIARKC